MKMQNYQNVDEYIKIFPKDVQKKLQELRKTIQKAAPDTTEVISYGIPTFKLNGKNLVHFGGYKTHIGFYPTPTGILEFQKELKPYMTGKGTISFPLDKPLPLDLITKIVEYRVKENEKR